MNDVCPSNLQSRVNLMRVCAAASSAKPSTKMATNAAKRQGLPMAFFILDNRGNRKTISRQKFASIQRTLSERQTLFDEPVYREQSLLIVGETRILMVRSG